MGDNHDALLPDETEHERRLRLIIEAAPNAMVMIDSQRQDRAGQQ